MLQQTNPCRGRLLAAAALLTAGLLLALGLEPAKAGGKKSHTKITATATKPGADGKQVVTVTLEIDKGWYAYANPVGLEDLEAARTEVKIASKGGKLADVKVEYPPGKPKKDEVVGNYRIYEDKVQITGLVRRAAGDTAPLEVTVKFMNCNTKGQCLPPETVKRTVP